MTDLTAITEAMENLLWESGRIRLRTERHDAAAAFVAQHIAPLLDEVRKAELDACLKIVAEDCPRPVAVHWRVDGSYSKHDKCPHDRWMYDDCTECMIVALRAMYLPDALAGESRT